MGMGSKQVLGKGLGALFPGAENKRISLDQLEETPSGSGVLHVALEKIKPNEFQPRRDFNEETLKGLAQSVKTNGILQPLLVRPSLDGYALIAGERRWRAAKLAGLKEVPIIIKKVTDREALEIALIENIQREDLNPIDEALSYFHLIEDFQLTQEEVSNRVGKERPTIANFLRLLQLPEIVIEDLKEGRLTSGHGKSLLGLGDQHAMIQLRNKIVELGLSVRETEDIVKKLRKERKSPKKKIDDVMDSGWRAVRDRLEQHLGAKVDIKGKDKGKISLYFHSLADFNRIVEILLKGG